MKLRYPMLGLLLLGASAATAGERKERATDAGVAWAMCVKQNAQRLAAMGGAADAAVNAAMRICSGSASSFRQLLLDSTGEYGLSAANVTDRQAIDSMYAQVEAQVRSLGMAAVTERPVSRVQFAEVQPAERIATK